VLREEAEHLELRSLETAAGLEGRVTQISQESMAGF